MASSIVAFSSASASQIPHGAASRQTTPARPATPARVISPPRTEAITVNARPNHPHLAAHTGLGALGTRSEFDTPFAISTVSAAAAARVQAIDINDLFRTQPGVQENSNGGATASGASFRVRGLDLDWTNGYKIDGFSIPYWYIDLPIGNFQQFQLVKGASAFLYGFGSPGAVLDFQLKKPVDTRVASVEAGYRSDSAFRQSFDVGGPLDKSGHITARLTANNEVGKIYNQGWIRETSVSGALRDQITRNLAWHADAFYLNTLQDGMINGVTVSSKLTSLTPISGRLPLGSAESWKRNDFKHFNTGFDWDFADNWSTKVSYAYTHLDERFPSNGLTFLDNRGDYLNQPFQQTRVFGYHQAQDVTEGRFRTGALHHDVVAGVMWLYQRFDADANAGFTAPIQYGNIYTTRPTATNGTNYRPRLYHYVDYTQVAPFWSDTITWHKFSLLAGARYTDYIENDYATNGSGRRTAARRNNPVTPVVSLSYKPVPWINAYFSYIQAMQSGTQAAATARNAYQVFSPIRSDEYEIGVKMQRRRWTTTLAAYRLDTIAAYVDSNNVQQQGGDVRYQGIEAAGTFQAMRDLEISGSFTYLDARYGSGTPYAGRKVESTSPIEASFATYYTLPFARAVTLNGGFTYASSGWLNPSNSFYLQSYLIGRIGTQYTTRIDGHRLTVRAALDNISNERYWVSRGALQLFPGAPRTVSLSARFEL